MGAAIFESLQLIKRVIVNLISCLHMEYKSVANTISKLISRVISEIIITRAFGTRVIISDITLLFVGREKIHCQNFDHLCTAILKLWTWKHGLGK